MAKISKEDLKKKISDSITDNDDLVISLLEDIEDSMDVVDDNTEELDKIKEELEDTKKKLSDITMKYKERFLNGDVEEKEEISDEGLKEEEVIDINEI